MIFQKQIKNLIECENLAEFLVNLLTPNCFLLLQGELGVGKTTLTHLIAKKIGIKEKVTSPTFTILQRYQIADNYWLNHFDFFRLKDNDRLVFFQELTVDNLNIIEWPEKNPQFWKKEKHLYLKMAKKVPKIRLVELTIPFQIIKSQKTKILTFFSSKN